MGRSIGSQTGTGTTKDDRFLWTPRVSLAVTFTNHDRSRGCGSGHTSQAPFLACGNFSSYSVTDQQQVLFHTESFFSWFMAWIENSAIHNPSRRLQLPRRSFQVVHGLGQLGNSVQQLFTDQQQVLLQTQLADGPWLGRIETSAIHNPAEASVAPELPGGPCLGQIGDFSNSQIRKGFAPVLPVDPWLGQIGDFSNSQTRKGGLPQTPLPTAVICGLDNVETSAIHKPRKGFALVLPGDPLLGKLET